MHIKSTNDVDSVIWPRICGLKGINSTGSYIQYSAGIKLSQRNNRNKTNSSVLLFHSFELDGNVSMLTRTPSWQR